MQQAVAAQELYLTRLAVGIVQREDDDVAMEKLSKALQEADTRRALARSRLEAFRAHVEVCGIMFVIIYVYMDKYALAFRSTPAKTFRMRGCASRAVIPACILNTVHGNVFSIDFQFDSCAVV